MKNVLIVVVGLVVVIGIYMVATAKRAPKQVHGVVTFADDSALFESYKDSADLWRPMSPAAIEGTLRDHIIQPRLRDVGWVASIEDRGSDGYLIGIDMDAPGTVDNGPEVVADVTTNEMPDPMPAVGDRVRFKGRGDTVQVNGDQVVFTLFDMTISKAPSS